MFYTFSPNELWGLCLFVGLLGTLFGASIEYVWSDYYRQVANEYKKELARQEIAKYFEKGGEENA